jgi:hypothetical protein
MGANAAELTRCVIGMYETDDDGLQIFHDKRRQARYLFFLPQLGETSNLECPNTEREKKHNKLIGHSSLNNQG